jgi:hypothetical protein
MKNLKLVFALFVFTQLNFAQQTYNVTEGELQFISNVGKIVLKKNNKFYIFKIENSFDREDISKGIKTDLEEISQNDYDEFKNEFNHLKNENKIIVGDEISNTVNIFRGKKYIYKKDKDSIQIQILNNEFFLYKSSIEPSDVKIYPYIILLFSKNQKIIYSPNCLVTFSNKKIFISLHREDVIFEDYISKKSKKFDAYDLYKGSDFSIDEYYKVDTLKNKKLTIKNIFNDRVINKTVTIQPLT